MDANQVAAVAQGAQLARTAAELGAIADPAHAAAFLLLDQLISSGMAALSKAQQVSGMLAIAHAEKRALNDADWAKIVSDDAAAMAALRKPA